MIAALAWLLVALIVAGRVGSAFITELELRRYRRERERLDAAEAALRRPAPPLSPPRPKRGN